MTLYRLVNPELLLLYGTNLINKQVGLKKPQKCGWVGLYVLYRFTYINLQ